jgi:hypothetical protein
MGQDHFNKVNNDIMSDRKPRKHSYKKQLQDIVELYRREVNPDPVELHVVAEWAIKEGKWAPQAKSPADLLAQDLRAALRDEYITDPQNRRVRRNHPRRGENFLSDGKPAQGPLWDDIRTASPDHMHQSFQQRRRGILDDNHQMKTDCDSYNQNWNKGDQIELSYDYTDDLVEMEQSPKYPEYQDGTEGNDENDNEG